MFSKRAVPAPGASWTEPPSPARNESLILSIASEQSVIRYATLREKMRTTPRSRWPETRSAIGTAGSSMFFTESGMSVPMICTLGTFFSPMCAASQILPSGPFFASTYCGRAARGGVA